MANGFQQRLISKVGYRRTPTGLTLDIRLPWYRSLPLSAVEIARLEIDGREVPAAQLSLEVNDKQFPVTALGELIDEWWYVLDSGYLHVKAPQLQGDAHEIDLTVSLYPPYIPGLNWVTRSQQTLRAA